MNSAKLLGDSITVLQESQRSINRYHAIIRIVLTYLGFATLWILFTDSLVFWAFRDNPAVISEVQSVKGMLFVVASATVIFLALRVELLKYEAKNRELDEAHDAVTHSFAKALEMRDLETGGHSRRVELMMDYMALRFGITDPQRRRFIQWGALLHDIGKMGIPDAILLKPGLLTGVERQIIEQHPGHAMKLLGANDYLQPALAIPSYHHERWDGTGYPEGLAGEEIPLEARIFAVVDVADALGSDRPYRRAVRIDEIYAYLQRHAGTQFDPQVVDAFLTEDLLRRHDITGNHYLEEAESAGLE